MIAEARQERIDKLSAAAVLWIVWHSLVSLSECSLTIVPISRVGLRVRTRSISFVTFGGKLHQLVLGIPTGTNCAPELTNLWLLSYEFLYYERQQVNSDSLG